MKERDLAADLAICEAVTSGPWEVVPVSAEFSDDGKVIISIEITLPVQSISFPEAGAIAQFIAAAREGWPEAIRCAMDAKMLDKAAGAEQVEAENEPVYQRRVNCLKSEVSNLREQVAQLQKQKQNIYEEYARIKANHDRYREIVAAINGKPNGDYWAWVPGEDNHLESLSCPVLIPAECLRNLLDEAKEEEKAELARVKVQNEELAAQNAVMRKALEALMDAIDIQWEHQADAYSLGEQALSTSADRIFSDRVSALEKIAELAEKVDGYMFTIGLQQMAEMPEQVIREGYRVLVKTIQEMGGVVKKLKDIQGTGH